MNNQLSKFIFILYLGGYMKKIISICMFAILSSLLIADDIKTRDIPCSISTSVWSLRNFFEDPGDFYQLTIGFILNDQNTIYLNGLTWKYNRPIGIPYGPSFESDEELYSGYARSFGLGFGYQYKIWKELFVSLYATPFFQTYHDNNDKKLSSGFQLFLQSQFGYEFNLFNKSFFIKPAVSFNYWPINTGVPTSFKEMDSDWPEYFLFEPHLNIGYRF